MVTVRTYWNGGEAAIAKSLLDDHEIFCSLADENVNLYGGGPFAMPIRLLVDEDRAELALRILDGDVEAVAELDTSPRNDTWPAESETPVEAAENNPWELLSIAMFFLLPAVCVLTIKYPTIVASGPRTRGAIAAVSVLHFLGWLAVVFAVSLIVAYFYLRRSSIAKDSA
jgi:hypothetical protein